MNSPHTRPKDNAMYANNFAKGPAAAHVQIQLAARLLDSFGAIWNTRGWALEHGEKWMGYHGRHWTILCRCLRQ